MSKDVTLHKSGKTLEALECGIIYHLLGALRSPLESDRSKHGERLFVIIDIATRYLNRRLREMRPDLTENDMALKYEAAVEILAGEDLPQGLDSDSRKARREQRQIERRNRVLLLSLRGHTRGQGWWTAFEEWRGAWNICLNALQELRGEAYELVQNLINEKTNLKEEVERQSIKERDEVRRIADDMLWVVWWVGTGTKPVEKLEFRAEKGQAVAYFSDQSHFALWHRLSDVSLNPDMVEVCKHAFDFLYQSFIDKNIPEMFHRIDEKIEVIDDDLDPFILRPLLVRTRCELCPV